MKITFNAITATIRQNADGLYSLTDIAQAWEQSGGTGGQLRNWKTTPEVLDMIQMSEIQIISNRGRNGETWGCKDAVIEYASYCSHEFRRAVRKAFIALTEGNGSKAAAIAESVAISPELIAKHDDTRETMVALILELEDAGKIKLGGYAVPTFYKLACKAATGYAPSVLTGKNGSAKDYIVDADHAEGLNGMIAVMESIIRGLRMGLDYHQIAAMLNVKTSKNGELLEYAHAA